MHRLLLAAARLVATTVIAGIAAWVSYWHMAAVAARAGEVGASAYLLPVSVDGLIIVASVSLVELSGRLRAAQAPSSLPEATHPPGRSHRSAPARDPATPWRAAPSTTPATSPTGHQPVGDPPSETARDGAPRKPQPEPDRPGPAQDRGPQPGGRPHPGHAVPQDSVTQRPRRGATEKAVIDAYLRNPALPPTAIAELVGTSKRSVRRYLERLKTAAASDSPNGANGTGHDGGNRTDRHP